MFGAQIVLYANIYDWHGAQAVANQHPTDVMSVCTELGTNFQYLIFNRGPSRIYVGRIGSLGTPILPRTSCRYEALLPGTHVVSLCEKLGAPHTESPTGVAVIDIQRLESEDVPNWLKCERRECNRSSSESIAPPSSHSCESTREMPAIIDSSGAPLDRVTSNHNFAFGVVRDFNFDSGGGGGWEIRNEQIQTADPWDIASVSLIGWELRFHGKNSEIEDHDVHHLGILPWITTHDSTAKTVVVNCRALIRDANGDDPWNGMARVLVSFYRQNRES